MIIEKGDRIPENFLRKIMGELEGNNIRFIVATENFSEWMLDHNLIIHPLIRSLHLIQRYSLPNYIYALSIPEKVLYWKDRGLWCKIKTKLDRIIELKGGW